MKYRFLLFDVDQTLLDFTAAQKSALTEVLHEYRFPIDETVYEAFRTLNENIWKKFERKEITKDELINTRFVNFCKMYDIRHPKDGSLERLYQENLGKACFLMPDAIEVVGRLSRHFQMFLVTNGLAKTQFSRIEQSGLKPYFQDIFVSEDIGAAKPSTEYFAYVYEKLGRPNKEDMIIIGDSMTSDINGGSAFGIDTCHVRLHGEYAVYDDVVPTYSITSLKELFTILYEKPEA